MGTLLHGFLPSSGSSQPHRGGCSLCKAAFPLASYIFHTKKVLCSCIKRHRFALKGKQKSLAQPSHPAGSAEL